ncbi:hypothetical protein HNE05_03125 [Aquipseudomonas campi]|uniref:YMGG-like Gly-zipper domain-containing protein n=1 Tax=Aquipseudomonas campi TaxID=2731681 RepID=A0A6M8FE29_9GAMM|nr:hypothetical protein [Pseudomonas campi]QKE62390.1 hypothetical protein HNE05_03125 [Pseudomonas campi]
MNRFSLLCLGLAAAAGAAQVQAETVVPLNGQSSQQVQADIDACRSSATTSSSSSGPSGQRLRGAAVGAAAGAVGSEVRGNDYDRVDDDVQDEIRQDRAKETAAAGMVVGGSRARQDRRDDRNSPAEVDSAAYSSCLQGRGYQVSP